MDSNPGMTMAVRRVMYEFPVSFRSSIKLTGAERTLHRMECYYKQKHMLSPSGPGKSRELSKRAGPRLTMASSMGHLGSLMAWVPGPKRSLINFSGMRVMLAGLTTRP